VVDAFTEQTEGSASVDSFGSVGVYMVMELEETSDGAMDPASKKEGKSTQSGLYSTESAECCPGLPPKIVSSFLRPVKDNLGLRTPGVYRIPCECGKVYIGQSGRSVDASLKEHQRHIRLQHPDKSAMVEHSVDSEPCIQFHQYLHPRYQHPTHGSHRLGRQ
jgi:hypothetical protein